jgi:OmcA/MtrC family decaheme c-type cytochrome
MSIILRGLLALATAGAVSFPTEPPKLATATGNAAHRRAASPTTPDTKAAKLFQENQLEYYLNDDGIAYIRPGLKIKVNSVTIGSDRKLTADLTLTDNFDQPLDRLGKITPGAISVSCILAVYDTTTQQYTSITTRSVTTPTNSPRPGVRTIQAGADSNGQWSDLELGHVWYKFNTALPENFDPSKTYTLGIYSTRNLTEQIGKNYYANVEYDFRPDGQKVTATWDKMRDASTCLNCHDPLALHGGSRRDVKLCVMCHQPQTIDPDTGETMDMKVMIHKIHRGPNLPSVQAGKPYIIYGNQQSIHDYSHVTYPQDIRNCDNCHEGTNPTLKTAQSDVWFTKPSRDACGSCHDDINWTTGEGHAAGPQANDKACATCHVPDSGAEFDASIKAAHTIPERSKQMKGIVATIAETKDFAKGLKPTVVFSVKEGGVAIDGGKLSTFAPMIAGNTGSYSVYYRETAVGKTTFDAATGLTSYTFTNAIPADASGTWGVTADVYRTYTLKRNDGKADITGIRDAAINPIKYVAVTGAVTPRRTTTTTAQCNACHDKLALHGGQRLVVEECVICHNPATDDKSRRAADAGAPESISMQRMIHRIHKGEELTQDFTVYGFGNTAHNYNEVLYPGDLRNCAKCHTSTGMNLPVGKDAAPVITQRDYFSPQGPGTAACLGCHDNRDAAAHAYLNTTTFPGSTTPAEACATCHGAGAEWAVSKVHAR